MEHAIVFNIQKFSIHDGPGIRSTIFLKGCPLNCSWCANPESQQCNPQMLYFPDKCIGCGSCLSVCSHNAIKVISGQFLFSREACRSCMKCTSVCHTGAHKRYGQERSTEEVWNEVIKDQIFYNTSGGGITFSGGEPLLWPKFINELSALAKGSNITTAIETCGQFPYENYELVKDSIDYILFDLKIMDPANHKKYCGHSNQLILKNFHNIASMRDVIVRIPVIPSINDTAENLLRICQFLDPFRNHISAIHLLPYHNMATNKYDALQQRYTLSDIIPPSSEQMEHLRQHFVQAGFQTQIGG